MQLDRCEHCLLCRINRHVEVYYYLLSLISSLIIIITHLVIMEELRSSVASNMTHADLCITSERQRQSTAEQILRHLEKMFYTR